MKNSTGFPLSRIGGRKDFPVLFFLAEKMFKHRPFAVYDIEATGKIPSEIMPGKKRIHHVLDMSEDAARELPRSAGVTEIAAVLVIPGSGVYSYETLLNPECPVSARAEKLNGISDEMVSGLDEKWANTGYPFFKALHDDGFGLAGFGNTMFDVPLKYLLSKRDGLPVLKRYEVDIRAAAVARTKRKDLKSLVSLAEHFGLEPDGEKTHRAMYDAMLCACTMEEMYKKRKHG